MGLQHLMRIPIMSKNKDEDLEDIVLTDLDTGVTLNIPSSKVVTHDSYSHMNNDISGITIDTSSLTSDYISTLTNTGVFSEDEFSAIYERPSDKVIRKRYTGHKKVQDISEVGIHTLEKMSKRGK
tara:strand:+ start:37 stop:411 length:375 start_codon:yes stop_codon:yes gene_type:complete